MTEANSLTGSIVLFLNYNGFVAWNVYNGGVYNNKRQTYMKNPTHKKGVFDICGFRKSDGKHLEVEVKVGRDKMSPYQEQHFEDLSDSGALTFVARNFDSFESWFKEKQQHEQPTKRTKTKYKPKGTFTSKFGSGIA